MSTSATSSYLVQPLTFNGQSTYSADFQQIIDRAVQTQSIPLAQLTDQQTTDQTTLTTLQDIAQPLQQLQSAITALASSVTSSALTPTISNTSAVSVTLGSNATAGNYQLEVDSLGSATQTISTGSPLVVTDPTSQDLSSSSSYTLTVNGTATTITPTSNNLNGLVSAINGNSALGVAASVVNVGSSSSPDYRLALQANQLGTVSISLSDGTNNLLQTLSTGTPALYKVDGLSQQISSNSDTLTLAPGVTATLLGTTPSGSPATISVAASTSSAQTALQNFATAYNTVVSAFATQHGQTDGALSGNSILLVAQQALESINGYTTQSGSLGYLSAVGLDLDAQGQLTFNQSEFDSSVGSNFTALSDFVGSAQSGFVEAANNAVANLIDPTYGGITLQENALNSDLTNLSTQITDQTNQINLFQQNLAQQLSASDAAISVLQSQNTFFEGLFAITYDTGTGSAA
ncbi:MAG TPA: flagellar filament capping protein FliD [Bryobacteraceae bacterium]|jgi:flagellar hook-associated protein 2|nr:flagellar filament capping protein FliD [Bryobacteraceae bacterium]